MTASGLPSAEDLVGRCEKLSSDIASFENYFTSQHRTAPELNRFKNGLQSEEKWLRKLAQADPTDEKTIINLRSTNLSFYENVWATACATKSLLGLQKRFYWAKASKGTKQPKKKSALVDVVAEGGSLWIKVSTISVSALLFDKAKAGWEEDEWDSSDDGEPVKKIYPEGVEPPPEPSDEEDSDDDLGRVELVKVAQDLSRASGALRIRFKHPKVMIILPNIREGVSKEVDSVLSDVRATGASIVCGSLPVKDNCFDDMTTTMRPKMTLTLNLDCTILLALISDLSHTTPDKLTLPEKPHPSLMHQIDVEKKTPLLPDILYPGLTGAERFVTSRRSATRMWEIVRTIGTPSERSRADALFAEAESKGQPREKLQRQFHALSAYGDHLPPSDFPLPVEIIDGGVVSPKFSHQTPIHDMTADFEANNTVTTAEGDGSGSRSRALLAAVSRELSEINRSVFLLGWTKGWTTVTSNKVAVKLIESVLTRELDRREAQDTIALAAGENGDGKGDDGGSADDGNADGDDLLLEGPSIWAINIARSLVGKEQGRGTPRGAADAG